MIRNLGPLRVITLVTVALVASVVAIAGSASASTGSTGSQATVNVPTIQVGNVCMGVASAGNWRGTICAIVNFNDAQGDIPTQALISFSVKSGGIREVYAVGGLYLDVNGHTENYQQSPSRFPGGARSSFLSTAWNLNQVGEWRAVVNTPCILWTNGQRACYHGVLRSQWVRGF